MSAFETLSEERVQVLQQLEQATGIQLLAELIRSFSEAAPEIASAAAQPGAQVKDLMHLLKGKASNLGADEVAKHAAKIEHLAGNDPSTDTLAEHLHALRASIDATLIELRSLLTDGT